MLKIFILLTIGISIATKPIETHANEIQLKVSSKEISGIYVETPVFRYCQNPPNVQTTDARKDTNPRVAQFVDPQAEARSKSNFSKANALHVQLNYDSDKCDKDCRTAISYSLLASLALWRGGCTQCDTQSIQAVRINETLWVDSVNLEKWRYGLENNISGEIYDPLATSRINIRSEPLVNYVNVSDHSVRHRICDNPKSTNINEHVVSTLCQGNSTCNSEKCMNLSVDVGKDVSMCQLNSQTIACGTPDQSIGLNIEDFKFEYNDEGLKNTTIRFGLGNKPVSLLYTMVHEVGHWFGLPHDDYRTENWPVNIMSPSLKKGRPWCVSQWNLTQLNNAVELGWTPRLHKNTGLTYEEN